MVAHVRDDGLGSGSYGGERVNGSEKKNRGISEANSSDNKQPSPVGVFVVFLGRVGARVGTRNSFTCFFPNFTREHLLVLHSSLRCPPFLTLFHA